MAGRSMTLDVLVRLRDLLTGPLRRLRGQLNGLAAFSRKIGLVGAAIAGISFMGPMQEAAAFQQQLIDMAGTANLVGDAAFDLVDKAKGQYEALALDVGQYSDTIAKGAAQMIAAGVDPKLVDASIGTIGKAATAANSEFSEMAGVATSLLTTLQIPADQLEGAMAGLVVAGKEGAFELKNMARFFPTLTSQMAKFGVTGREAVNTLGAALQIAMKGTTDPAEAANNLKNFLSKILAPATIKNFAEAGVDIEAVMQDAATKGINPIEAVVQKIAKLTGVSGTEIDKLMQKAKANGLEGADALAAVREQLEQIHGAGALGELFSDMQVMDFLIPMLGNLEEYKRIKSEVAQATGGVIDEDFETQMRGLNRQFTIFKEIGTQASREVGLAFGTLMPSINSHLMSMIQRLRELDAETGGMVRQGLAFAGVAILIATAIGALGFVLPVIGAGLSALVAPLTLTARAGILIGRHFATAANSSIALQGALAGMNGQRFTGLSRLAIGLRGMAFAIPSVSGLTAALGGIGTLIAGISAPIWLLIGAVAALALAIYNYWEPISNFVTGFAIVVGSALAELWASVSGFAAEIAGMVGEKILDLALWLGFDQASIDAVTSSARSVIDSIVGFFGELPALAGQFLSDIFTMNDYSSDAEASFKDAGVRAGQAMVDAIKGAFGALFEWFTGLGGRILGAIGKIDLSGLINWPSLPSWLGGESSPVAGGSNDNAPAGANDLLPAQGPQKVDVGGTINVQVTGPAQVTGTSTQNSAVPVKANTGRAVGRN